MVTRYDLFRILGLTCVRHLIGEDQVPSCGLRASDPCVCTFSTQLEQA